MGGSCAASDTRRRARVWTGPLWIPLDSASTQPCTQFLRNPCCGSRALPSAAPGSSRVAAERVLRSLTDRPRRRGDALPPPPPPPPPPASLLHFLKQRHRHRPCRGQEAQDQGQGRRVARGPERRGEAGGHGRVGRKARQERSPCSRSLHVRRPSSRPLLFDFAVSARHCDAINFGDAQFCHYFLAGKNCNLPD